MRKIYSLVLMATMLLIGTNAWAELHDAPQLASDEAKVKIGDYEWQYATTLKEAFDAVEMEQTATIVLLNHVTYERKSYSEDYGITIPHVIDAADMSGDNAKQGPNITLNLNGKNIETGTGIHNDSITIFRLVKGTLNITGTGTIHKPGAIGAGESTWCGSAAIAVGGTNDKTATNWSTLTIGKDVTVHVETKYTKDYKTKAIAIVNQAGVGGSLKNPNDVLRVTGTGDHANPANMLAKYGYYTRAGDSYKGSLSAEEKGCMAGNVWGTAYGVKVIIEGTVIGPMYGVHMHGNINARPNCVNDSCEKRSKYLPAPYHQYQFPYINITSTAHVRATDTVGTTGIYSSGYGVLDVSGEVEGATGIYMKGGDVLLKDAIVKSNVTESGQNEGGNSGIGSAAGSGIVIETSEYYAGNSGVTVAGDTKVTGGGGYAIQDRTTSDELGSTTSHITIEGGTIEGGKEGAIVITEGTVDVTSIAGGNLSSNTVTVDKGNDVKETVTVNNFLVAGTHTTVVKDGNKDIVVVSQGAAPTDYAHVQGNAKDSVNWIGTGANATETLSANLTLKELEINQDWVQTLTIPENTTLTVGRVVLGVNARIIVEAGGKFIVTGEQGIVAKKDINIKLESNATKQAIFLFNPGVSSNKHPNATVQYVATKSYRVSANDYQWERFGVPTWKALNSIKCTTADVYSYVRVYENGWQDLGWIHNDDEFANLARMNKPFATYNMLTYVDDKVLGHEKATYVMTGELVGNMDATLNANLEWNAFTNSYSAEIDVKEMLLSLANANYIEKGVYTAQGGGNGTYTWDAVNLTWIDIQQDKQKLALMQAFILRNEGLIVEDFTLDYEKMVWDPVMDPNHQVASVSGAPRRAGSADDESARLRIIVANEQGTWDNVKLTENATASSLKKYMNDDVNIYAMADEKAAIVAAEDLEDSYFGFSTVKGGEFTISFADVEGREFDLIDLETGVKVAVMEGEAYSFAAAANTVADYRFKLVERAKMPTSIENTEAVKSVKGIYTITGQYLGEMNVWNTLPAGVYVVNGEKLVK